LRWRDPDARMTEPTPSPSRTFLDRLRGKGTCGHLRHERPVAGDAWHRNYRAQSSGRRNRDRTALSSYEWCCRGAARWWV